MRTASKERAIRNAFFRLGLHATPKEIVQALGEQGVEVEEELVRQVRLDMLNESTKAGDSKVTRPVPSPGVRRRPQDFPGRQGRR
jgi:hypothetical protein